MLAEEDYVKQSLELNLFFMRIAKEHSFFLETTIPQKSYALIQQADLYKNEFEMLLTETIRLADEVVSPEFLTAGEMVTDLTLDAERLSELYTDCPLDTRITRAELAMEGKKTSVFATLVDCVNSLNQQAMDATRGLIEFKAFLLDEVLACRMFTFNYPLLLDHILREVRFYLDMLERLQNRIVGDLISEAIRQEAMWNRIMAEHAKFIRGTLDPTEVQLFDTADNFDEKFDILTAQAEALRDQSAPLANITEESWKATADIRDFKKQGTEGLVSCKIKSIALPLLGDHVTREANYYLCLLENFKSGISKA